VALYESPMTSAKGASGAAWVTALAIGAALATFIAVPAFSHENPKTSVDGKAAVYSQYQP
jgi:hypothetical protein